MMACGSALHKNLLGADPISVTIRLPVSEIRSLGASPRGLASSRVYGARIRSVAGSSTAGEGYRYQDDGKLRGISRYLFPSVGSIGAFHL
jgi:hypothetical protein